MTLQGTKRHNEQALGWQCTNPRHELEPSCHDIGGCGVCGGGTATLHAISAVMTGTGPNAATPKREDQIDNFRAFERRRASAEKGLSCSIHQSHRNHIPRRFWDRHHQKLRRMQIREINEASARRAEQINNHVFRPSVLSKTPFGWEG